MKSHPEFESAPRQTIRTAVRTETVDYAHGGVPLQGTISYDRVKTGRRPGVLVVHAWMGHGLHVKRSAEELANMGFTAFAIDMFGKDVRPQTKEEAMKIVSQFFNDRKLLRERALAALEAFKKHPLVDTRRIAVIGYCFGGTTALEMARSGLNLAGAVSFHGALQTPCPAGPGDIKMPVLVLHGAEDAHVNAAVPAFLEEMRRSGADWQMVFFGGAVHNFTEIAAGNDPSTGSAYNEKADRRSWAATKAFFGEIFR